MYGKSCIKYECGEKNKVKNALRYSFLIVSLFIVFPAFAQVKVMQGGELPRSQFKEGSPVTDSDPVVLSADHIDYDQAADVVIASGNVEIIQNDTVILADSLLYDRVKDQVQASGNVSMLEASGNVYFANAVEFNQGMKTGIIQNFKARLSDDSVAVAGSGHKISETITELFNVSYTPCKCLDDEGNPKNPFWSIRADKAHIDQGTNKMSYENAYFDVGGSVPLFYAPYFSHATPGADNQSGLLLPSFLRSQNLGEEFWQPVYYSIAPDRDITVTPVFTTKAGQVLAADYRQKFDSGKLSVKGSITNAPNIDALGNNAPGHEIRGHYDVRGAFAIDEKYDWGFNAARATDDTYMRLYHMGNDTLLTSRIYAQGFNIVDDTSRSYASIEGLSFQGLTGKDNSKVIPIVAPLVNFNWQSAPMEYNSRLGFDANSMLLYRDIGAQSRRLSGTSKWSVPYVSDSGQVLELETQLRTDVYNVDNVQLSNGKRFQGTTGRAVPQASATWHYPFINRFESSSVMLEPVVMMVASPGGGNPEKIPNEDSVFPDFTDANLFSTNRFAGYDRIETGARTSYGLRSQIQIDNKYIDGLFGQQYRANNDPNFPITSDLNSHLSDYVGKVGISAQPYNLSYRFRLDKDNFYANRSELDAGFNIYPVSANMSYLSLKKDPILTTREVLSVNGSVNFDENWSINAGGSRDLRLDQTVSTTTGFTYKNECVMLTTMVGKDYTNLLDIEPSLTFWFRVSLKNLD
jgi:LPS-assembly protein